MWSFLPILLSCSNQQPSPIQVWADNPQTILEQLDTMAEPKRTTTILSIIETYPKSTLILCQRLEKGPAKRRCETLMRRPHLWTQTLSKKADRQVKGPASRHLHPNVKNDSLSSIPSTPPNCENGISLLDCIELESQELRDPNLVASMCNHLSLGWREECFFTTAEHHIRQDGFKAYETSVLYCLIIRI